MHHIELVTQLDAQHLEQLPELIAASTHADGHEPLGEHKFLRLRQGDDLALGLLAYEDGRLTGYAHILTYGEGDARRVSCEVVVHPERRGEGLGRKLLASAVERARAENARRLDVWSYNDSGAGTRIAAELGFEPSRRLLHLHRHLTSVPAISRRADVTVRTFRPGEDDERWLALNNRIFQSHPENGCWTLDDLRSRFAQPWFSAGDFLLLEAGGELAGFCWLKVEERGTEGRVGEIYVIGTAPEQRGRGLGKYLVERALAHMRGAAVNVAAIYVDEANAPAVALYEQSGFHYHHVDVCYSRAISSEDLAPTATKAATKAATRAA